MTSQSQYKINCNTKVLLDLLFCGTGWLSDTSFLLITFYYLGYYGGYCADFVLTEKKIARKNYGFGEFTLKLTHPHIALAEEGRDT